VKPSDNLKSMDRLDEVCVCVERHTICNTALSDIEGMHIDVMKLMAFDYLQRLIYYRRDNI
jgi:hypothetical protein